MITYKGRVVYEREKHFMTEKDAARIMLSFIKDTSPEHLARKLWAFDMQIVKAKVLDDEDIMEFVGALLKLIIEWVKPGLQWLWDFTWDVLTGGSPAQPDVSEETKDG